jgi:hypothetical protein
VRSVLPPLQQLTFRDFSAEEFLGGTLTTCRGPGGCVSVFKGSTLTLGQLADASVYFGGEAVGATQAKPGRQRARPGAAHKTFPVALCLPIPSGSRETRRILAVERPRQTSVRIGDDSLGTFDHGYSFAKRQTDG